MDVEEAYDIIERIVVNGFLTAEMRIEGSYVVMKNMTDREFFMLDLFRDSSNFNDDIVCKLSFCTYSIDGNSFLTRREEVVPVLMDLYKGASISILASMNMAVRGISERYYEVLEYLEGFCYTDRSRYLWKVYKEGGLFVVPGSAVTGLNAVQENWAIVNRQLDSEEEYEREFNLALMVASSFNGKGARVIGRNFETSKNEAAELRKEIARHGYNRKRVEQEKKQAEWTAPLRSREDLVRELYRQMRGEKDKHDLFMDKWMQKQRDKAEQIKRRALERSKELQRRRMEMPDLDIDKEESRAATPEEISKLPGMSKSYVTRYISSGQEDDMKDRFIKKISTRVIG